MCSKFDGSSNLRIFARISGKKEIIHALSKLCNDTYCSNVHSFWKFGEASYIFAGAFPELIFVFHLMK